MDPERTLSLYLADLGTDPDPPVGVGYGVDPDLDADPDSEHSIDPLGSYQMDRAVFS